MTDSDKGFVEQLARNVAASAFPAALALELQDGGRLNYIQPGMTLRDYFAAKALPVVIGTARLRPSKGDTFFECWACDAYALADAMLKVRDEKKP